MNTQSMAFHGSHLSERTLGVSHGIKTGSHSFELSQCAPSGSHSVTVRAMETPGSHRLMQSFSCGGRNLCCTLSV